MRLLNTNTLDFEWFTDSNVPSYLILSHRWQGAEVTLQDFVARDCQNTEGWTQGTRKVAQFVDYAKEQGSSYVWIDTVCIDKTSSTELQEAINSMYEWYERSEGCVVYLDDVKVRSEDKPNAAASQYVKQRLIKSQWFTRGWTLQELLAPRVQIFVDKKWSVIGSRDELMDPITTITTIDRTCFGDRQAILREPVAKRMSWMSSRTTSRSEDLAYCMLGIFGINLTMLYGEGRKAFLRLQKEIIQEIEDDSIFIWQSERAVDDGVPSTSSILAPDPACFKVCGQYQIENDSFFDRQPYRMTTRGLEIEHYENRKSLLYDRLLVVLNSKVDGKRVCLPVVRIGEISNGSNIWRREQLSEWVTRSDDALSVPPMAVTEFNREVAQLSLGTLRTGLKSGLRMQINPKSHLQMPVAINTTRSRLDYELEPIKYLIYIT